MCSGGPDGATGGPEGSAAKRGNFPEILLPGATVSIVTGYNHPNCRAPGDTAGV